MLWHQWFSRFISIEQWIDKLFYGTPAKSSYLLPRPMYFTGILNWSGDFDYNTAFFSRFRPACLSSHCRNLRCQSKLLGLLKCVLSGGTVRKTSNTSFGASGTTFFITFLILVSSFIRPYNFIMQTSGGIYNHHIPVSLATAELSIKATEAISAPIFCLITGTPHVRPDNKLLHRRRHRKASAAPDKRICRLS